MRQIKLNFPVPAAGNSARLGRLTRHLRARLLDFGPGGPEVLSADESAGLVTACFPGHHAQEVQKVLSQQYGIYAAADGSHMCFYLNEDVRFEDLDYLWGCLFEILA